MTKSQLEKMEKCLRGSPSLTRDITRCITSINNHLLEYTVFALMNLQNDVNEIKTSTDKIAHNVRQIQFIENFLATAGTGQLPTTISRGHAILVDATGREHPMLLDQCQYFDQLDLILRASLFRCTPDEAEIQRWYIEKKQYDFVIYDRNDSDVIKLTRESDIWSNLEPGSRVVMRVITESDIISWNVTATYKCPCGISNECYNVSIKDLKFALDHGCTIICTSCSCARS
ncbi:hypothetical protein OG21DRAFT_270108 [Imleria badia]|nr:hypothetical protein OG21DRAFT_270108 [Imleria badia]